MIEEIILNYISSITCQRSMLVAYFTMIYLLMWDYMYSEFGDD